MAIVDAPPSRLQADRDRLSTFSHDLEQRVAAGTGSVNIDSPIRHQLIDYSARGLDLEAQAGVFRELAAAGAAIRNSGSVALILAHMAGRGGAGAVTVGRQWAWR